MPEFLIPVRRYERVGGTWRAPRRLTLSAATKEDLVPLSALAGDLAGEGVSAGTVMNAVDAGVSVRRNRAAGDPESYRLTVLPGGVEVVAPSSAGAYYGIQTLRELARLHGRQIPSCRIEDAPLLRRRAVHIDCSRGKVRKLSTIKALVEQLAHWKVNELQLYIENTFKFRKHPDIGRGFSAYSPRDIKEIQSHCRMHHISLVPSLASFGHMEKILMLPRYAHLGEMRGFRGIAGGTTLCPGDAGSIRLLADMYGEFLPLFDSEEFNVCCDEPWELGKGRSRRRAARAGVGRVYLDFILKIRELCLKHGKRINMWGEVILTHPEIIPLLPKDIVALNWDYAPRGPWMARTGEFADAGLAFMCCPGTHGWRSHGTRAGESAANISHFSRMAVRHGAEGLLNTDWGDGGHRNTLAVSLCALARGAAHAWNTRGVDDGRHLARFSLHTFGDTTGRLARVLEVLGRDESGGWAYGVLNEHLDSPALFHPFYGMVSPVVDDCRLSPAKVGARIRALEELRVPRPRRAVDGFRALSLEEFELARQMELAAYRRLLLARAVRAGRTPSRRELARHGAHLEEVCGELERLWLERNRPSRLADNKRMLRRAVKELRRL